jgi:hypothetical protein
MGNLGEILKGSVARLGITRQIEAVDIVEKATEEIAKFIPREDFEVISFNRGTLKIKTRHPAVSSEIMMSKSHLLSQLPVIKKIRLL